MWVPKTVSRLCFLSLAAALAGCAVGNTATSVAPAAAPPAAAAEQANPAPQRLTSTEINEQCWMDPAINKIPDLDKRMKLVDKCVDQKIKAQGGL
jgi:hypothetical protein